MPVSREEGVGIKSSNYYYWNIPKISQTAASANTGYLQVKTDLNFFNVLLTVLRNISVY
jgi:hypothetical protein